MLGSDGSLPQLCLVNIRVCKGIWWIQIEFIYLLWLLNIFKMSFCGCNQALILYIALCMPRLKDFLLLNGPVVTIRIICWRELHFSKPVYLHRISKQPYICINVCLPRIQWLLGELLVSASHPHGSIAMTAVYSVFENINCCNNAPPKKIKHTIHNLKYSPSQHFFAICVTILSN